MKNCDRFDDCAAPLCPLDGGVDACTWYPDDPICPKPAPAWLMKQKRIREVATDRENYFTGAMIKRMGRIYKSVYGLNPERPHEPQEARWLEKHPERKGRVCRDHGHHHMDTTQDNV